jgi:hypothetical protein
VGEEREGKKMDRCPLTPKVSVIGDIDLAAEHE